MVTERHTILLVDDTDEIRVVWRRALMCAGFRVFEAADGQQGIDTARQVRPDVIVMDVSMPILNGIAATRQLKADLTTADVPVLIVSADIGAEQEAYSAGCDRFLRKPIRHEELIAEIRTVLAYREECVRVGGQQQRQED